MYARGILFGKMKYELGDHSFVRCPENGFTADVEFRTKGYFSGTYNAIGGVIRNDRTGETLYELSGNWAGEMVAKNIMVHLYVEVENEGHLADKRQTGQRQILFDATTAKHTPPLVRPLEDQEERESQKLWHKTIQAVKESNHTAATDEKTKIEDAQRDETARRQEKGIEWQPKYFRNV